jgi:hypothetical protein
MYLQICILVSKFYTDLIYMSTKDYVQVHYTFFSTDAFIPASMYGIYIQPFFCRFIIDYVFRTLILYI